LKVKPYSDWYNTLNNAFKVLMAWAKANFPTGLNWNPKGSNDVSGLEAYLGGSPSSPTKQEAKKPEPS